MEEISARPLSVLISMLPFMRSREERAQDPRLPHSSYQQVANAVIHDCNIMIQDHGESGLLPDCCRVPTILRHHKEEGYTPKVVSIGPFHHGNERLQDVEKHKQILFQRLTQRAGSSREDLVPFVQHLEPKVRASYLETINLIDTTKFIDMILLDAGFIIELFIMSCKNVMEERGNKDAKLIQPWLANAVLVDLLLLENQLPFFFIEELFNKAFPNNRRCCLPSFLGLTYGYFENLIMHELKHDLDVKIKHFTNLLRLFYLQGNMPKRQSIPKDGSHILSYNANAFQEAGIKLRQDRKSKLYLDLKFSGHTLEIPQIVVDDYTELLFHNMIALEQCHYSYNAYITDHAFLLDWLIDTNKDVDILIHKKIVRNYLGDTNNVASLINGLSDNVVQSSFNCDFVKTCKMLNGYCEDPCNQRKATLRRDYYNTPWRTVASIAGIILLVLSIVQTIFSVLQVVLKK